MDPTARFLEGVRHQLLTEAGRELDSQGLKAVNRLWDHVVEPRLTEAAIIPPQSIQSTAPNQTVLALG